LLALHYDPSLFVKGFSGRWSGALKGAVDGGRVSVVLLGVVREWLFRSAGVQGSAGHAGWKSRPWLPSRTSSALAGGVGGEVSVDRVADASLERSDGGAAGHALVALAVVERAAGAVGVADLGDAAMWMTWFRVRFPRRESRWIACFGFPEDHSMGAVPL
jgi:hypothetical protein